MNATPPPPPPPPPTQRRQVSLFLLRGEHANTLITIFQSDGSDVTRPILAQLREPRTLVCVCVGGGGGRRGGGGGGGAAGLGGGGVAPG